MNMNKIEEGIAANDAAITDVKNNYMPVSGGFFMGSIGIGGNVEIIGTETLKLSNDGSITFPERASRLTGISDDKGTSSTLAASLKCLNDNYLPLSGGTMTGTLIGSSIVLSNDIQIDKNDGTGIEILSEGSILFFAKDHILDSTITGISDSKGTSSTYAVSQKCLNDNYVAKSDLPSNLLKYQIINSTSDIGTDANTAYLILE